MNGPKSPTPPNGGSDLTFQTVFPSDSLAGFAALFRSTPALAVFSRELIQLRLVLDANEVQRQIRFRLSRTKANARSGLHEAIAAGVVIAFVPRFIDDEIAKYLGAIAADKGCRIEQAQAAWAEFRAVLRIYDPAQSEDSDAAKIDPKDVPYKLTFDELGADAVLTTDKHLARMGVTVIRSAPAAALRDYARASSVTVGVGVSAGLVVTLSVASLRGIYAVIEKSLEVIGGLPEWAKLLLAAAIVTAVAHPKSRNWLLGQWRHLKSLVAFPPEHAAVAENAARYYLDAQHKAMAARATLNLELPPARPRTAIQFARVICAASAEPISLDQIFIRMTAEGYVSEAKSPHKYIRQQMRLSGQFIEAQPGLWRLRVKEELQAPA